MSRLMKDTQVRYDICTMPLSHLKSTLSLEECFTGGALAKQKLHARLACVQEGLMNNRYRFASPVLRLAPAPFLVLATLLTACGATSRDACVGATSAESSAGDGLEVYVTVLSLPAGTCLQTTTLNALNAQTGQLLWKAPFVGETVSLPVAGQNTVYLLATHPATAPSEETTLPGSLYTIAAFDADTGKLRWQSHRGQVLGMSATPGGLLVAEIADDGIAVQAVSLAEATGDTQWTYTTSQPQMGQVSLVVAGAKAYLITGVSPTPRTAPTSSVVTALDVATGKALWQAPLPSLILSLSATSSGVYISSVTDPDTAVGQVDVLTALDASSGQLRWQQRVRAFLLAASSNAQVVYIEVIQPTSKLPTASIQALAAEDGQRLWSTLVDPLSYDTGNGTGLALANDTLFASFGVKPPYSQGVLALSASDGSQRWKIPTNQHTTPPAVNNGVVCVGLRGGETDSVKALSTSDGSMLWVYQVSGTIQSLIAPSGT
jgi:outer membrane protein assembly factor BamB